MKNGPLDVRVLLYTDHFIDYKTVGSLINYRIICSNTHLSLHLHIFLLLDPSDFHANCHSSKRFTDIKHQQLKQYQRPYISHCKKKHASGYGMYSTSFHYTKNSTTYRKYTGQKMCFVLLCNFCFRHFLLRNKYRLKLSVPQCLTVTKTW